MSRTVAAQSGEISPRVMLVAVLSAATIALSFVSYVWYHAIVYEDGWIHACVDCMGEGILELAVFLALQGLCMGMAVHYATRHPYDASPPPRRLR